MRRRPGAYRSRWRPEIRTKRRYRLPLLAFLGAIAFIAVTWGWRVRDVQVAGATLIPNAAIRDSVLADLQGTRWGIVPRTSVMFSSPHRIERMLRDRFALERVDVRRRRNGTVSVDVREHAIAGVLTGEGQPAQLLSVRGAVVGTASDALLTELGVSVLSPKSTVPVITFADAAVYNLGDHVLTEETMALISAAWQNLQRATSASLHPRTAFLSQTAATVELRTANGARVTLTTAELMETQIAKLRIVLQQMSDAQQSTVKSIDLRYGDRVYVQ